MNEDIDVIEFSLDEDEINEWISELERLRGMKESISLTIDDENELQINYAEGEE